MDIYQHAVDVVQALPVIENWPEMLSLYKRAAEKHPHGWDLPLAGAAVLKQGRETALCGVAALGCLQIAIILVDDILDEDPKGEYRKIGTGQAANMAVAFQSAGLQVIEVHADSSQIRHTALSALNQMLARTAYGQHLDAHNPASEEAYWQVVEAKSVPYYQTALQLGTILAGGTPAQCRSVAEFGALYGEMIQIHDDLKDTMMTPADADWMQGRMPLPILFAHLVDHPERAAFEDLRLNISAPGALEEAQHILVRCGAVSYCLEQLIQRYQRGQQLLARISLPDIEPLTLLLEDSMEPVREVFETLGVEADVQPLGVLS